MTADRTAVSLRKTGVVSTVYNPFPIDALPEPLQSFTTAVAEAVGTDHACVALPLLATVGATIGTTCCIRIKDGWKEYPVLWVGVVGESGSGKTPAMQYVLAPVEEAERLAVADYGAKIERYERDKLEYEKLLATWKRQKGGGEPPEKPTEPTCRRYVVSDITIESLAERLSDNPRGVLLYRDELAAWLGSFERYRVAGSDLPAWLSMHSAGPVRVDRKTSGKKMIYVPRAFVAVAGGIQPKALRRALSEEFFDCGLAARLLLVMPPRRPRRWMDATVPEKTTAAVMQVFSNLLALPFHINQHGHPEAVEFDLTDSGKTAFVQFVNEHGAEQYHSTSGDLCALWSKLEATCARLALILHVVRVATITTGDGASRLENINEVDGGTVNAAISLVRWLGNEGRRVYSLMRESEEEGGRRELAEVVRRAGGEVSARDLMRHSRRFQTAEEAEAALTDLATHELGDWFYLEGSEQGGRPTNVFRLRGVVRVDTTPEFPQKTEVVSTVNKQNDDRQARIRRLLGTVPGVTTGDKTGDRA